MQEVELEAIGRPKEIVDILSGNYQVHWTTRDKITKILARGIYSRKFAQRIGDQAYQGQFDDVFVTSKINIAILYRLLFAKRHILDPTKMVGVIVDQPPGPFAVSRVPLRIAPRQFLGLVLTDGYPEIDGPFLSEDTALAKTSLSAVSRRVKRLKTLIESNGNFLSLPIYGISGDVYLPQRISHEEIVQRVGSN